MRFLDVKGQKFGHLRGSFFSLPGGQHLGALRLPFEKLSPSANAELGSAFNE